MAAAPSGAASWPSVEAYRVQVPGTSSPRSWVGEWVGVQVCAEAVAAQVVEETLVGAVLDVHALGLALGEGAGAVRDAAAGAKAVAVVEALDGRAALLVDRDGIRGRSDGDHDGGGRYRGRGDGGNDDGERRDVGPRQGQGREADGDR